MKRNVILSFLLVVLGGSAYEQTNSLSGIVTYDNDLHTIMKDSTVVSLWQGATVMYSNPVQTNGSYLFENITPGTYTLKSTTTKFWFGGNAVDCLAVLRQFVQLPPLLSGLRLTAADVNGSGGPGSSDGLAIARRFVGMISNFMPPYVPPPGGPDWLSQTFTITIDNGDFLTQDIKMICAGDCNGSNIPL